MDPLCFLPFVSFYVVITFTDFNSFLQSITVVPNHNVIITFASPAGVLKFSKVSDGYDGLLRQTIRTLLVGG